MAIRIRKINGHTVALCAAKTSAQPDDIYLDDDIHHALTTKFNLDFYSEGLMNNLCTDSVLARIIQNEENKGI